MQLSSTSSALAVSFQTTPSSVSAFWLFLFFFLPPVVFLSLHSLSVLLIVLHVSGELCQ